MANAVEDAITAIREAAQLPAKERSDISNAVKEVVGHARHHGLSNLALIQLIQAATKLDTTTSKTLIQGLYPAQRVPASLVYTIASQLGPGRKPHSLIQGSLVRWLVLVQDVLAEPECLGHVYGVLFNLLDVLSMRADLCHLLASCTRRQHVEPFRADMILNMQATFGIEPALTGLLKVFRSFRPDLVPDECVSGRAATLDSPNEEWRARLEIVQAEELPGLLSKDIDAQFRVLRRGMTSSRGSYIPEVRSVLSDPSRASLEDIDGVKDFVNKLDILDPPSQLAAMLSDPLLQHYTALGGKEVEDFEQAFDKEVGDALYAQLELLQSGESLDRSCVDILQKALKLAQFRKHLSPESLHSFLFELLKREQGRPFQKLMLDLLSWGRSDFGSWKDSILPNEVEQALMNSSKEPLRLLLMYYTSVLQNHSLRHLHHVQSDQEVDPIEPFCEHASVLALNLLATSEDEHSRHAVVSYLEALARMSSYASSNNRVRVLTPNTLTVYLLFFSYPAMPTLSRVCSLLADYKATLERVPIRSTGQSQYENGFVTTFNGFLMDACNLLWRARAFNIQDNNAVGCLISPIVVKSLQDYMASIPKISPSYALPHCFSLSYHPALAGAAAAAWHELEQAALAQQKMTLHGVDGEAEEREQDVRHAGPVSRLSLQRLAADGGANVDWSHFRSGVLDWLDARGVDGVSRLMRCTMKLLMGKPERSRDSTAAVAVDSSM